MVSRGPPLLPLLFFGGIAFAIANTVSSAANNVAGNFWTDRSSESSALGSGTSVVQISVALEVPDRDDPNSILSVLNRLSETARTDSRVGIQNLSSEVAMALLRRQSSIVSAYTDYYHFRDRSQAERDYNSRAVMERGKFEQETVSKYGGVDYRSEYNPSAGQTGDDKATMAVVTLVLAIDGDSTKVPKISSISDVTEALTRIASHSKMDDCLQSVEILWTPESRFETLTRRDVIADYPELRTI